MHGCVIFNYSLSQFFKVQIIYFCLKGSRKGKGMNNRLQSFDFQSHAFSFVYENIVKEAVSELLFSTSFTKAKKCFVIFDDAIYNSVLNLCFELEDICILALSSKIDRQDILLNKVSLGSMESIEPLQIQISQLDYDRLTTHLLKRAKYWVDSLRLILEHIFVDRYVIEKFIKKTNKNTPCMVINEIASGLSDSHGEGKTVAKIVIENTVLYYKPRNGQAEKLLSEFIGLVISEGFPANLNTLEVISRPDYTWSVGLVRSRQASKIDAEQYHYYAGSLLCLSWLFGMTDLHHENIFSDHGGPIVIDAEGILQPNTSQNQSRIWEILRTGLVGLYTYDNNNVISDDISGFHMRTIITKYTEKVICRNNLSGMRILSRITHRNNIRGNALYDEVGVVVNGLKYIEYFLNGFMESHSFLRRWLSKTSGASLIDMIDNTFESRVFLRPTKEYILIRNGLIQKNIFPSNLEDSSFMLHENNCDVISAEMNSIYVGDVPMFHAKVDECSLYSGSTMICDDYFQKSAISAFQERIRPGSYFLEPLDDLICDLTKIILGRG